MMYVKTESIRMSDISLGKSIYTKKKLEELAPLQESQSTRKAYLAETAELAYGGRDDNWEW
jgi:hypothetical protein